MGAGLVAEERQRVDRQAVAAGTLDVPGALVVVGHRPARINVHPDAGRRLLSALTARQRAQLAAALEVLADELDGRGAQRTGFSA
jgi:hypothetical protein